MNRMRLLPAGLASVAMLTGTGAVAGEPAFGEPTVYGRINLTLENAKVSGAESDTKFVDNGSRLGLRAGYSVANETVAMIQIEGRLRHDPNGWVVKSRDTWVGLQDNRFGTARYGMMEGPLYHATYDEISMHNHNSGRSEDKLLAEDATGGRMGRSLYYRAPIGGPFKVEMLHAFLVKDPKKVNAANPSHDEFAVTYEQGESWIAGGYAESRNLKVDKAWTLAAATPVKGFILAGVVERSAAVPAAGGPTAYRNYARVALKYPVGKHEFHINHGVAGSLSTTPDSGATQSTLGYNYNLNKESKLYAFITRIGNKQNAAYSFLDKTSNGAANSSIAIGYRQNF